MTADSASIRRPLAVLAATGLAIVLVLALLSGRAEGKPAAHCPIGVVKVGCALPVGTSYAGKRDSDTGYVITQVDSLGGISVAMHAYVECQRFDPSNGNVLRIYNGYSSRQKPKIGMTYEIEDSVTEPDEAGVPTTANTEVTVAFKSSKKAVLTIHQVTEHDGALACDATKTWTLKRP